ncbi:IGHMBP2 family helicase [Archaeoglobus sp.]
MIMLKDFIDRLKELVEIERKAQIVAMLNEIRCLSGEERERRGRAILNLNGKVVGEEFGYTLVKFGRRRKIDTNINVGDLVLISRGNPLKSDLVGVVAEKGNRYIVVALENVPSWALKDVRIDLYANDVTFRRWLENLENLGKVALKSLKFALRLEEPDKPEEVNFNPIDERLNESQRKAVALALGSNDFFLIHGPFGTGKTRTLAEIVRQEVKRGKKVLATAESNIAVDNLVGNLKDLKIVRLGHPSRTQLKSTTLSAKVVGHEKYREVEELKKRAERLINARAKLRKPTPALRRGLSDEEILELAEKKRGARGISWKVVKSMAEWTKLNRLIDEVLSKARALEEEIAREVVEDAEVVLATNSTAFTIDVEFDVAVIDEATQSTIPSVLIPINKAEKFVLAGDHKQLPPTVLKAEELSRTLFEMLIEMYPEHSKMLEIQYRMNEKLMEFPNVEFYGGRLKADGSVRNITLADLGVNKPRLRRILDPDEVLVFVNTSKCRNKWERRRKGSMSRENPLEAKIVKEIVESLIEIGVKAEWIGVITPYDDQVDLIRRLVNVEVNTVDGYQGREKEVVIISFVRSNKERDIGFLNDLRRLNVALTRAKRKLIAIGDAEMLSVNDTYRRFIDFVKSKGLFVEYC